MAGSRTADYFNSGLLLLNLAALRRDGMSARLAAFGREGARRLKWPDQDALNALLGERCLPLHPRWNCQNSLFYYPWARRTFDAGTVAEALRDPAILHFEGGGIVKPWHYLSRHPYRARYLEHRRATPWPEVVLEGRTALNRLLHPLPTPWTIAILKARRRLRRRIGRLIGGHT
jgi:lipopolysaccharide biosynthesis glycosyltransferase